MLTAKRSKREGTLKSGRGEGGKRREGRWRQVTDLQTLLIPSPLDKSKRRKGEERREWSICETWGRGKGKREAATEAEGKTHEPHTLSWLVAICSTKGW